MGFRSCGFNTNKLATELGVSEDAVKSAMAKSRVGGLARVFSFEDKGTFGSGRISISKKLENGTYEPTFQDGFVAFFGGAYDKIRGVDIPEGGLPIIILSCDVVNNYVKETKKLYTNFSIYDLDFYTNATTSTSKASAKPAAKTKDSSKVAEVEDDNDLPF